MLRCLRFTTSGTHYYYHPDTRPKNFRLFRYAYPSSSLRCSRKRPSLLSLTCASGRLSFAVGERYYCVYFLSAISFHVRTYADASFHITIQARSTNTRFTYVQSSTLAGGLKVHQVFIQPVRPTMGTTGYLGRTQHLLTNLRTRPVARRAAPYCTRTPKLRSSLEGAQGETLWDA